MRTTADDKITGWQLLTIGLIFTLSGAAVEVPIALHDSLKGESGLAFVFLVIVSPIAAMIAVVLFAAVGAPIASIPLLLMQRWMARANVIAWMFAGALVGMLVGAFHPFVLLWALIDYVGGAPTGCLKAAAIASAGGCLGGLGVGWWFRTWVLNPVATGGGTTARP